MSKSRKDYLKSFKSSIRRFSKSGWNIPEINYNELSLSQLRKGAQAYITGKATKISAISGKEITYSPYRARQEGSAKAAATIRKKSEDSLIYKWKLREQRSMNLAKAREAQAQKRYYEAKAQQTTYRLKNKSTFTPEYYKLTEKLDTATEKLAKAEADRARQVELFNSRYVPSSFEYKKRARELEGIEESSSYEYEPGPPSPVEQKQVQVTPSDPLENLRHYDKDSHIRHSTRDNAEKAHEEERKVQELIDSGKYIVDKENNTIIDAETGELIATFANNLSYSKNPDSYYLFVDKEQFEEDYQENYLKTHDDFTLEEPTPAPAPDDYDYEEDYDYSDENEADYYPYTEQYDEFVEGLPKHLRYYADRYPETVPKVMSKDMTVDELDARLDSLLSANSQNEAVLAYIKRIKDQRIAQEGKTEFYKRIRHKMQLIEQEIYVVTYDSNGEEVVTSASIVIAIIMEVPQVPQYIQDELRKLTPKKPKTTRKRRRR